MRRGELANAAEAYIRGALRTATADLSREEALAPVVARARGRLLGVGAEQYQISETEQSFERSTVGTMLVGKIEEQVDDLNYSTMLDILIERRLARGPLSLQVRRALLDLQSDLRDSARLAATSAALMNRHIERLVALGEYERRGEADYVSQLAAECDEAGAAALDPDAPEGLDAIVAAFERDVLDRRDDGGAG